MMRVDHIVRPVIEDDEIVGRDKPGPIGARFSVKSA